MNERQTIPNIAIEIDDGGTDITEPTLAVDLASTEINQLIAIAHRFPRQRKRVLAKLEESVLFDEAAADNSIYVLPRAKKPIPGPSIGFANALASAFGNCWDTGRWISTDRREKVVIAEGNFFDCESGRRVSVSEQRRIVDSRGNLYTDDMIIITGKAAAAIARRNAILQGISRNLWFPTYEKALYMVRGSEETLPQRRDAAFKALAQFGIAPKRIVLFLGLRNPDEIGIEHIPTLRGMYSSLRDGSTSVEELLDPRRMATGELDDANPLDDAPPQKPQEKPIETPPSNGAKRGRKPKNETSTPAPSDGQLTPTTSNPSAKEGGSAGELAKAVESAIYTERPADPPPSQDNGFGNTIRRSGTEYLKYVKDWLATATSVSEINGRFLNERVIRNNLGTPLTEDQITEMHATVQVAIARLKAEGK